MGADDAEDICASLRDPARFGAVFDRYYTTIWTYLARVGGRDAADDLAGEVFTRAFAARAAFDPGLGSVPSWLYGIATNVWRTHARSFARGHAALQRAGARGEPPSNPEDGVDASVDARRAFRDVVDALDSLPEADRLIIVLYAWEQLSYADIAGALGVPVGTVRSRLARARQRLRELASPSGEVVKDDGDSHERSAT